MSAPGAPDRDDAGSSAAEPRAEPLTASEERREPDQSPTAFLDRIGAPGLAEIELDTALPFSPPRDVDFD